MAEKSKTEKHNISKESNNPNFFQKVGAFFVKIAKRLKNFFIGLKAELKRVIWPDRKRLIQSTATVLAICLIVAIILFIVDSAVGGLLRSLGFYESRVITPTTAPTTVSTTVSDTTTAESGETTASGTAAATTAAAETTSAG